MAVIQFLLKTLFSVMVLVLILVVCAVGLAVWSIPKFAPKLLESWIESRTGFSASVNTVNLKIFSGSLDIEGMALINPPYYQSKNFMQIKQISVQIEPKSLFWRRTKVYDDVSVDIDRITWVKNAQGSINIVEFLDKLRKKGGTPSTTESNVDSGKAGLEKTKERKQDSRGRYIIKKLTIKVGGIDLVGFPSENDSQSFAVNYTKEFTDITDLESIVHQVIADFSVEGVFNLARDALGLPLDPGALGSKVTDKIQKGVEKAFRFLQKVTK